LDGRVSKGIFLHLFQKAKAFCILSLGAFPATIAAGYARWAMGICKLSDFNVPLSLSNILAVRLTFPVERNLLRPFILASAFSSVLSSAKI